MHALLETHIILPSFKVSEGFKFCLSDTKSMNTCSFIIHSKKINVCSKEHVEWEKIMQTCLWVNSDEECPDEECPYFQSKLLLQIVILVNYDEMNNTFHVFW